MKDFTNGKISDHKKLIGHFDGGCEPRNPGGVCSSAWILHNADNNEKLAGQGKIVRDGKNNSSDKLATNNFAEYCAFGLMLKFLVDNNWRGEIHIFSDSKLVVHQVTKDWKMKSETLKPLRQRIWDHLETLELEVRLAGQDYECFVCDKTGPMEELIDRDSDGENMICPTCTNTITGWLASNCTLEWVRRDLNEEADAIGRQAYEAYCRANNQPIKYMNVRKRK